MAAPDQVEEARQFVRAFGPTALFTVRFVSKDKKAGEKLQTMSTDDFVKQLPELIRKSHTEQKHLFVRPHGSNIVMLDADDDVSPDGHAEYLAMALLAVVATSGFAWENRQHW